MCECIVLRPWDDVVWFSHSDVDLTLWAAGIALARGDDATVAEADVAPIQLQGPRAADVLGGLADADLAGVGRHRCALMRIAGVEAVVSNTGWSREAGYEIYPLGSDRAGELWDALCAAGEPHGMLVTGPNIVRAVEQGISDTQYATNSDMNPIEAGIGGMLDLERDFVGGDALRAVRDAGPARRTVGLVCDGEPFPPMELHWPVTTADGAGAGVARWAVYSFALERNIAVCLVDARLDPARRAHRPGPGRATARRAARDPVRLVRRAAPGVLVASGGLGLHRAVAPHQPVARDKQPERRGIEVAAGLVRRPDPGSDHDRVVGDRRCRRRVRVIARARRQRLPPLPHAGVTAEHPLLTERDGRELDLGVHQPRGSSRGRAARSRG